MVRQRRQRLKGFHPDHVAPCADPDSCAREYGISYQRLRRWAHPLPSPSEIYHLILAEIVRSANLAIRNLPLAPCRHRLICFPISHTRLRKIWFTPIPFPS